MESMNDEWRTGIIRLPILGSLLPPSLRYRVGISSEKKTDHGARRTRAQGDLSSKLSLIAICAGETGESGQAGLVRYKHVDVHSRP